MEPFDWPRNFRNRSCEGDFKVHRCFGAAAPKENKNHGGANDPAQGSMQSAQAGSASPPTSAPRKAIRGGKEGVLGYRCGLESGTPALYIAVLIKDSKSSFQDKEVSGYVLVWKALLKPEFRHPGLESDLEVRVS